MKEKRFNLQFFADDPKPANEDPKPNGSGNDDKVVFTKEQQEYLNSIIDKTTARIKKQAEDEFKVAQEKAEAERLKAEELAKITDEKERKIKELELKQVDFEKERQAMHLERMTNRAMTFLNEEKLPVNMAKYLVRNDEAATKEAVADFKKSFNEAIATEVAAKLAGVKPPEVLKGQTPEGVDLTKMTPEQYLDWRNKNKL